MISHNHSGPASRPLGSGHIEVICLKCQKAVGYTKAGRQADGTYFQPGRPVHAAGCLKCQPDGTGIAIVEHSHQRIMMLN